MGDSWTELTKVQVSGWRVLRQRILKRGQTDNPLMATSQSTMDFLLDVLSDSRQVTARRMFGEFCLYFAGRPVGLVCDEQLFLKPSEAGRSLMTELREGAPFPGARPHLRIGPDDWDDRQRMNALVRATFDALPPPKLPKMSKATKASKAPKAAQNKRPPATRREPVKN